MQRRSNLSERRLTPEIMDQPDLDEQRHQHALRGLARINFLSQSVGVLWPAIRRVAEKMDGPLRVLDVASGGGDVAVGLWRRADRAGVPVEIVGVDMSSVAIECARGLARKHQATVQFERRDVLVEGLPDKFDVVMSSLFLHHLEGRTALELVRNMGEAANELILISDLRRCVSGYWLAQLACRLLTTSDVVHVDGPRSYEGAFTVEEMTRLFKEAGLQGARIQPRWPFRMLVEWQPS